MAHSWYFGPVGDLQILGTDGSPAPEFSMDNVRYGGVHQGLSGAATLDILDNRWNYEVEMPWTLKADYDRLDSMYTNYVPGPYRLINPMKKNRFSVQSSSCRLTDSQTNGIRRLADTTWGWEDYQTAPYKNRKLLTWTGTPTLSLDYLQGVPVFPLENVKASVHLKASAGINVDLKIEWLDRNYATLSTSTTALAITTSWVRYALGAGAPAGAAVARVGITLPAFTSTTLSLAEAQFENVTLTSDPPTTWELGGGAPEVFINELSTTSPRYTYRHVTLSLLET